MSKEEIMAFLNLEPPKNLNAEYTWHYKKMSLYWLCVAMSGARTSEIANLTINRVDFGQQVFKVIGKMGERKVPIKSILFEPLQEHIKQLKGEYLFPSMRTPRPIEKATWNLDFNKRIKRLGIKRDNLTPYSLRHSFATRNWRNMSLAELQKILGHRNISTTLAYTHLVVDDMIDAIKRDSLGMEGLDFNSRFKLFRDDYRKLLQVYAFSPLEEKEFIKNLL
jgi:integrase